MNLAYRVILLREPDPSNGKFVSGRMASPDDIESFRAAYQDGKFCNESGRCELRPAILWLLFAVTKCQVEISTN